MADREILIDMLNDALAKEKLAEKNCKLILKQLAENGVTKVIEKIKNDEHEHQKIVLQLIDMLN